MRFTSYDLRPSYYHVFVIADLAAGGGRSNVNIVEGPWIGDRSYSPCSKFVFEKRGYNNTEWPPGLYPVLK